MTGIYKITNQVTGNFYIGQSKNIHQRLICHFTPKAKGHSELFAKEISEYPKEVFKMEILEECTPDKLNDLEVKYIQELKPTYNIIVKGQKRDSEFSRKVSEGTKKWWDNLSEEDKQKIINNNLVGPRKGHEVSEETRELIRIKLVGRKQPDEVVKRRAASIRETYKNKPKAPTYGNKKTTIVSIDGLEHRFDSAISAAEFLNCPVSSVRKSIKLNKLCRGALIWYEV